jgi:hypothetical protein
MKSEFIPIFGRGDVAFDGFGFGKALAIFERHQEGISRPLTGDRASVRPHTKP